MTTFTQRPGPTGLRYTFWLDERDSLRPDATGTNRTLEPRSFLWPSGVLLLRGNGGCAAAHDIFHSRQSFPTSCLQMFYVGTLKSYAWHSYPFDSILPHFCDVFVILLAKIL